MSDVPREREKRGQREREQLLEAPQQAPREPLHGPPGAWPAWRGADQESQRDAQSELQRVQQAQGPAPEQFDATRAGLVGGRDLAAAGNQAVVQLRRGRQQHETENTETIMAAAREGLSGEARALPFLEQLQRAFGPHDLSGVRAHLGSVAQSAAQRVGALAYASGRERRGVWQQPVDSASSCRYS